ncbi:flagellar assembly protein FliW [Paenibacillus albus]|uniref:Flagellar assembly factor FliW n=1 Tax=Paenibacillus albus TaxID=2495582 RepID=A0A3S8ZYP6_9BACL|nr:flagellar assembly protein FliW [Paenibacillus albus]AZN38524.1 flagellar assembly protein FliW [Paenibacillus albus]
MELQTSRFGTITVEEDMIYSFSNGIPGFEGENSFILISPEEDKPLSYLQSVNNGDLAFIITDPFVFYPEYDFELPESAIADLEIESVDQVIIQSIISINGDMEAATMNLIAPIVINTNNRVGKQVVLGNVSYTTKHPLFALADK